MITLTIVKKTKKKNGTIIVDKNIHCFKSIDSAKKVLLPIMREVKQAEKEKRDPDVYIDGVSFDSKSERNLLIELGVIELTDNETILL